MRILYFVAGTILGYAICAILTVSKRNEIEWCKWQLKKEKDEIKWHTECGNISNELDAPKYCCHCGKLVFKSKSFDGVLNEVVKDLKDKENRE